MVLERIRLASFRNYRSLDVEPAPGLNIFTGRNGQGKSNLLEAIAMLATGKSFRARRESELIMRGDLLARIAGDARISAGTVHLHCTIDAQSGATRKSFGVNGATVGFARFLGQARVVTFIPADLALVTGSPALRRSYLNTALAQSSPRYYADLARYSAVIAQKNALLRGAVPPDRDLLLAYNDELTEPASRLIAARATFVAEIAAASQRVCARWTSVGERLEVNYEPSIEPDHVAAIFARSLDAEIRRRQTIVGPHRDDLRLEIDGRSLASFGSQGQQRTAVLALKVAEYEIMRARAGDAPILLLDDVLSELDAQRAAGFLDALGAFDQAFITSTELPASARAQHNAFTVTAGTLAAC